MFAEGTPKGFGTAGSLGHDSSNPEFYSQPRKGPYKHAKYQKFNGLGKLETPVIHQTRKTEYILHIVLTFNSLNLSIKGLCEGLMMRLLGWGNNVLKNNLHLTKKKKRSFKETFSQVINTRRYISFFIFFSC